MMKLKRFIGGLLLVLGAFITEVTAAPPEGDFVMVVNIDNAITTISRIEAELMFLSKKRSWPSGTKVTVVINENPEIYDTFSHAVLRRSSNQFMVFRKKMLFRGQGMPPSTAKTDTEVVAFVASHVGGLGYVSPDAVTSEVRVIPISR